MTLLHVDSVVKKFGDKLVLSDVFISCKQGEIIGILGRNGSGKSTLLKIIFGSLKAEYKFVRVGDRFVNSLYDAKGLVGYLPQEPFMPNHVKVHRVIGLFCDEKNASIIAENKLVKPLLNKKAYQLSGGERRVLEILLIVHSNVQFVLLDEPFNGVAPIYKEEIKRTMEAQSLKKGFIITDHDYRNVLDVATRTILIHDGTTRTINQPDELLDWGYLPR